MEDNKMKTSAEINKKVSLKEKIVRYLKPQGDEVEMMRYRQNKGAKYITFFALACTVAGFSTIYGYGGITKCDFNTGLDIFGSILILLFSFLASVEMGNYSRKWSYVSFGLAAFSIIRIFIYPFIVNQANDVGLKVLDDVRFTVLVVLYIVAAFSYVLAGVLTLVRSKALGEYLKTHKAIENEIIKEK